MFAAQFPSYACLFIAQLAIACATIFGRFALQGASSTVAAALRMSVASVPLLVFALVRRDERLPWRVEATLALAGGVLAAHFIIWLDSLQYASVAVSTLLVCSTPLWNSLYDVLVLRRVPPWTFVAGLVSALVGLGLIVQGNAAAITPPIPGHPGWGAALATAGAMLMALYLILVEYVGAAASRLGFVCSTRSVVTRTFSWAAIDLMALVFLRHDPLPASDNFNAWGGILGMALFSQLVGHSLMNGAVRTFAASLVALAGLLIPVFAAGLAAVIFHEHLTGRMLLGSILILLGLVAALQKPQESAALAEA